MASFKTHISFGIALGVAAVMATAVFSLAPTHDVSLYAFVALAAIVGAILPDMDSDTGLPVTVTFGSLTLVSGEVSLLYALKHLPHDSWQCYAVPVISMLIAWFVVGGLFKKFTVHRGMAHSIPAALVAGLVTFFATTHAGHADWDAFLMSLAMTAGYLLHLILDEINSAVNFHGTPFVPNAALGSALKLTSKSTGANIVVYGALLVTIFLNFEKFFALFAELAKATASH